MEVIRVNNAHLAAKSHEEITHHEPTLYLCPEKGCPCKFARCIICQIEWHSPKAIPGKKGAKR